MTTDEEPTERATSILTLKAVQIRYVVEFTMEAMSAVTCFFMLFVLYTTRRIQLSINKTISNITEVTFLMEL